LRNAFPEIRGRPIKPNKGNNVNKVEYDIVVEYRSHSSIPIAPDPENYLFDIHIKIIGVGAAKPRDEVVLGEGLATKVRVAHADDDEESLFFVFDSTADILAAGAALYDASFTDYRPAVIKQFPGHFSGEDLLLVRRLTLLPEYRKQKIGLAVLHRILLDLSDGCGLTVIKPYPLGQGKVNPGRDKLRRYWERLGFKRLAKSAFWAFDNNFYPQSAINLGLPSSIFLNEEQNQD